MGSFKPTKRTNQRSYGSSYDDGPTKFSRDSPRSSGRDFERRDLEKSFERRMHTVICAKCGERCEVPFRPRSDKPVYCNNCFRKDDHYQSKSSAPSKGELDRINEKLDKIMDALDIR